MMRSLVLGLLLSSTGLLCGCGQVVDVTKTAKEVYAPTRPDDVEILTIVPKDRNFAEVATISTSHWVPDQTAKMHNALRAKAAPLGANAVILNSSGIDYNGYLWATGTAFKFK